MKSPNVPAILHEAMKLYESELGRRVSLLKKENWPAVFRYMEENIHWPRNGVCCVIQKPDGRFWMLVMFYEKETGDISLNYVTEDGTFHILVPLFPDGDNDPFREQAIAAFEKLEESQRWRRILKKIRHTSTAAAGRPSQSLG